GLIGFDGEQAQVYVSVPGSGVPRRLAGWARINLNRSETQSIKIKLEPKILANWNIQEKKWVMPSGEYIFSIGSSSRNIHLITKMEVENEKFLP
ncbi:MAG: fibronectin type III-like domain-contianing protein, partial [Emcibacteraceae bacterium]|nr:fibronectin type III-like domain-contianing protein [Emcibacteraceae bacterium]